MTSSVIITCTYPFTADDNHLQKSTILSSARCHSTGYYDINLSFTNFVRKIDQKSYRINFCVIRLLYQVSAHNLITHLISFEELSYVDCQNVAQIFNKDQSIHFTNKPFRVVEIIGIRKDAIHEPRPDHQLGFFCVCDKMLFQICTHLTINELIFHWAQCWSVSTRWSKVDHCEIWSFVKCGFLPSSCISQFVIMEIIYRHYKLKIEHFSHSLR